MKKLTIEDMHTIAKERGGRCLSKTYVNVDTKLKWQCEKGHVWEAIPDCIKNRGQWCPYCSGKKALEENCLHTLDPSLAKEWHPTKNSSLTPRDVVPSSHKKVWWRCDKGHEWQAIIDNRHNKGSGCPYCSGLRVSKEHCLQTVNHRVAREWHPTKNGSLTPKDVTPSTDKKVWWLCSAGHAWQASVGERSRGKGCPYCCGRLVCSDNCLETLNPSLAKEWHPTKNGSLTPKEVTPGSNKKVWWLCQNGHEWQVTVNNRTHRGTMCPYCSGRLACDDNCLETLNPKLAKEWHPTKNGSLTPRDVTLGSGKKVWWVCKKGHEWQAVVGSRNKGAGCPYCKSKTSLIELRLYTEFKYLFDNVQHRKKIHSVECDIYLPTLKVGIEVDGLYWHRNRYGPDSRKTALLQDNDILLIRLREEGLTKVSKHDLFFTETQSDFEIIDNVLSTILETVNLSRDLQERLRQYSEISHLMNEKKFIQLLELLPSPLPEDSLYSKNKSLLKEWHPTKNGSLTTKDVSPGSKMMVWWICKKGHEWQAPVERRNAGHGCPYCSGHRVCKDNCLQTTNPEVAREWHPTKNELLTPEDVTPGSGKKVWWLCKRGHEWQAKISHRSDGVGCPFCSGHRVCKDNCLQTLNPTLAKEWHPTKNGSLTPRDVTPGSGKKVWWLCKKGHEWQARIQDRNRGKGCMLCYRKEINNHKQTVA